MRVLIVAAAVLACAAAAPSGALLAGSYAHGLGLGHGVGIAHGLAAAPVAYSAHIAPALPTISHGDLQGAAIDAHVNAVDHARASIDAAREYHDQASELQGKAINAAESHSWQAVDAVKTAEAQLDGAAAGVAPVLAKQLAGHVAPIVGYSAPLAHAAPLAHSAALAYAAPALASKTVVSQSLSQTHPGVIAHAYASPVVAHAAPLGYAAHGLAAHGYAAQGYAAQGYAAQGYAAQGYAAHGLAAGHLAHAW